MPNIVMDLAPLLITLVITWIWIWICHLLLTRKSSKLPPGPFPFPIIGNILQLGPNPHHSLARLSRKYGPLMSLKLGVQTAVVVSSPNYAKLVLQKHDLAFSSRMIPASVVAAGHDKTIGWAPVDALWRKLRKICKEELFSVAKLDAGIGLRREKLRKLSHYLTECCLTGEAVNIGQAAFTTTLNLISSTFFSMEFAQYNSGASQELKNVLCGVLKCHGRSNIADYFPILKKVDPQGRSKETKIYFNKLFAIFDDIIMEKMKSTVQNSDLLDALLEIHRKDTKEFTIDEIKRLLLDLFVAGIDTTSITTEWAMTELVRNPNKMVRAREEICRVIKENNEIEESDISRLPYLQAVVKEIFRLHAPAPLLVPHRSNVDVEIDGYVIPNNTKVFVNVWAIGRDSNVWPDADLFMPERFLDVNSEVDFKGKHFELLPFGAGRRICPGLAFADRMLHLMLATFLHKFNWKLEQESEIDMSEIFGLTLHKIFPLKAIPILE